MDMINDEDLKRLEKLTSNIQPPTAAMVAIRDERIEEEQIIKIEKMEKDNENIEFGHSGVGLSRLRMLNKNDDVNSIPNEHIQKSQKDSENKEVTNIPGKYVSHIAGARMVNHNEKFKIIQKLLDTVKLLCDNITIESSISEHGLDINITVTKQSSNNQYTSKLANESLNHEDIYSDIITWLVCCVDKNDRQEVLKVLMNVFNFLKGENKCI